MSSKRVVATISEEFRRPEADDEEAKFDESYTDI